MKRHDKIRKVWLIIGILIILFWLSVPVNAIIPEWSEPKTIVAGYGCYQSQHSFVYDADGNWHLVYSEWDKGLFHLSYKNSLGEQYIIVQPTIDYSGFPSLAISPNGDLLVMYRSESGSINSTVKPANGGWSKPEIIVGPVPNWNLDSPSVVYDQSGNWHMVYGWMEDSKSFLTYKNSLGEQYDIVQSSADYYDHISNPSIAISPSGDLLVMYRGYYGGINSTVKSANGEWSKPEIIVGPVPSYISGDKPSVVFNSSGTWHMMYGWYDDPNGIGEYQLTYKNSLGEQYTPLHLAFPSCAINPNGYFSVMGRDWLPGVCSIKYSQIDNGSLDADFEGTPTFGPVPLKVVFTDTSLGAGDTPREWKYKLHSDSVWTPFVLDVDSSYIFSKTGSYDINLTIPGVVLTDFETKERYINITPLADFSATPLEGKPPVTVQFTDLSTGEGITSRVWQYKNNTDSDSEWKTFGVDKNPAFTFTDNGTFDIKLTAMGSGGFENDFDDEIKYKYISVHTPPVAEFEAITPTSGPGPLTVTFKDRSTGEDITSREWYYRLSSVSEWTPLSTDQIGEDVYRSKFLNPGTYDIKFKVTGLGGPAEKIRPGYITVEHFANFDATPTEGPAPLDVQFTDTSTGVVNLWEWSFGDGGTSNEENPLHTYENPGTYTVSLKVSQWRGGSDEKSGVITVTSSIPSTTGQVSFDEKEYHGFTGAKKVIVNDPDMNIDPVGEDSLKINILSIVDGEIIGQENGYELTLIETGFNTGIFEAEFYCTNVAPGAGKYIYVDTAHQGVFHALYIDPVDANGNKDQPQSADAIYDFGLEVTIERDQSYWELTYPLNYHSPLYDHTWSESGAKIPITITVSQDNSPIEGANIYFSDRGDYVQGVTDWRGKYSYSYGMDLDERTERTFTVTAKTIDRQGITDPFNMYKRSIVDGPVSFKVSGMDDFIVDFHRAGSYFWQGFDVTQHPVIASWNIVSTLIGFSNNLVLKIVSNIGNTITTYEVTNLYYNDIDFTKDPTVIVTLYRYDWKDPDGVINKDHPLYLLEILLQQNGATTRTTEYWFIEGQFPIPNIQHKHDMLMMIQSPVVLWITAPDGTHAGYDPVSNTPVNEFPSAFSNKGDEPFYFYIPQLSPGEYHIDIIGTESGSYTLTITDIDPAGTKKDITTITGQTTAGKIESFIVTVPESGDIVVYPANQPPDLQNPGDQTVTEGKTLTLNLVATDPDNDPLTYTFTPTLSGASITANTFSWTPLTGSAGKYSVTFNVTDTGSLSDEEKINITVTAPTTNVPTTVKIVPKTINLGSKGYFLAFATLPEAYKGATIDMKTVTCSGATAVRMVRPKIFPRIAVFVFKTSDLTGVPLGTKVPLTLNGEMKNKGTTYTFTGSDTIKVISKPTWQPDDIKDISKESDDQLFKKFNM